MTDVMIPMGWSIPNLAATTGAVAICAPTDIERGKATAFGTREETGPAQADPTVMIPRSAKNES